MLNMNELTKSLGWTEFLTCERTKSFSWGGQNSGHTNGLNPYLGVDGIWDKRTD